MCSCLGKTTGMMLVTETVIVERDSSRSEEAEERRAGEINRGRNEIGKK
jgi:hypothetical protein